MRTSIAGMSTSAYHRKYRRDNKDRLDNNERVLLSKPGTRHRRRANRRRFYANNQDAEKARIKVYRSTLSGKITQWKSGAKRRGIDWEVTAVDIEQLPPVCHYTGLELTMDVGERNTFSIDRLDSSRGYVRGNIVPCCAPINKMKLDLKTEDFLSWCNLVARFHSHNVA